MKMVKTQSNLRKNYDLTARLVEGLAELQDCSVECGLVGYHAPDFVKLPAAENLCGLIFPAYDLRKLNRFIVTTKIKKGRKYIGVDLLYENKQQLIDFATQHLDEKRAEILEIDSTYQLTTEEVFRVNKFLPGAYDIAILASKLEFTIFQLNKTLKEGFSGI